MPRVFKMTSSTSTMPLALQSASDKLELSPGILILAPCFVLAVLILLIKLELLALKISISISKSGSIAMNKHP